MPVRTYPALAGFYAADRRRKDSRELDLGLAWRERNGFPTFRAAWVADTGEVYLVQRGRGREAGASPCSPRWPTAAR